MKSDLLIVDKEMSFLTVKPPEGYRFLTLTEGIAEWELGNDKLPWSFWVWSERLGRALRLVRYIDHANIYVSYVVGVVDDGVAPGCVWKKKKARGRTEAKR